MQLWLEEDIHTVIISFVNPKLVPNPSKNPSDYLILQAE